MTLDQLRIFLKVAEQGHVTRAAQMLNLTQSAVSASLAALETTHDVKLFDRVGRGIALTEAGRQFIPSARAVLDQARLAGEVLNDLATEALGSLRLQASQTVANYWLPPILVAMHESHPRIDLTLTQGNTGSVAAAVLSGAADMGFVEGEITQDRLERRVVAQDELVLVMARDHPLAGRDRVTRDDYLAYPWIIREPGSGTRSEFDAHLAEMGIDPAQLSVFLEMPSNEAILAAIAAGPSLTMLSRRAVGGAAPDRNLRAMPVTWARRPERHFSVLTHPDRYRTRAQQALLAILESHAGQDL